MSETAFDEFRAVVLADNVLRDALHHIDDRAEFVQTVVELAAENGFDLSVDDVENAVREGRRAWIERWI